jgi:hypothetical protein
VFEALNEGVQFGARIITHVKTFVHQRLILVELPVPRRPAAGCTMSGLLGVSLDNAVALPVRFVDPATQTGADPGSFFTGTVIK